MAGRVRFGPFELDSAGERLEKHGTKVRLVGQPMRILLLLLAKPGEVVTRDELRHELWGDGTFVDFEQGLNTAINKLRQTLGDSAESPRYIETVPGRGYRFIAPVADASTTPVTGRNSQTPESARNRRRLWKPAAAGLALVAVSAIVYWLSGTKAPSPTGAVIQFTVEPPPGYWLQPAATRQGFDVSPNGKSLVFTARGRDGHFHAWRRDLSDSALHPLPAAENAHTVFWGPDSKRLFYLIGGSLRAGDAAGGPFQVLAEQRGQPIYGTVLGPDRLLLMANRTSTFLVPAGGGDAKPLPTPYPWAEILPDREHVLYLARGDKAQNSLIRTVRFGDNPEKGRIVVRTNSRARYAASAGGPAKGHLLYVRAGVLMAQPFDVEALGVTGDAVPLATGVEHFATSGAADFSVSDTGVLVYQPHTGRAQMTWVDRAGQPVGTIGPAGLGIYHLRLSPDQTKVVAEIYDVGLGFARVWVFETASGTGRPITEDLAGGSVWSPDSRGLIYSALASAPASPMPHLFLRNATEGGYGDPIYPKVHPEQLQVPTDWSRDGRFVVYQSRLRGDVWVADLKTEGSMNPLLDSPAMENGGALSPDGQWLAFISDEAGRPEVYLQAFEAKGRPRLHGERLRISRNGALSVRWRRDGSELYYAGADGKMYAVPVALGNRPRIGTPAALFDIEIEATTPVIAPFTFDVSADGKRFLLPRLTSPQKDHLVVVDDWHGLLH